LGQLRWSGEKPKANFPPTESERKMTIAPSPQGELNREEELVVLSLLAKITSVFDFHELLNLVVNQLPAALGAHGCSIYLVPEYVPRYAGKLYRDQREMLEAEFTEMCGDYIVLAATNSPTQQNLIGRAYYCSGEGITGWAYQRGAPQRIANLENPAELQAISPTLKWVNAYQESLDYYPSDSPKPLLIVPLVDAHPIGVMKFHGPINNKPFSDVAEKIAIVVGQIISGYIRQRMTVDRQNQSIMHLIEVGNKQSSDDVVADVTSEMQNMFNCARSQYYSRNSTGTKIRLRIENGEKIPRETAREFARGQSLIGWVYKTGRPLILGDVKEFLSGITLDPTLLEKISDGKDVNEEDRLLRSEEPLKFYTGQLRGPVAFLAVPVKSKDESVIGVLCAYSSGASKFKLVFNRSQLQLLQSFASTISLAMENEREHRLSELLIDLGNITELPKLFEVVVNKIPHLVTTSGCSIFITRSSKQVPKLVLQETSRKGLKQQAERLADIFYDYGEGKTGMCAQTHATLVFNCYGEGQVSLAACDQEIKQVQASNPHDLIHTLRNQKGQRVGLIRLIRQERSALPFSAVFRTFAETIMVEEAGLPSEKMAPFMEADEKVSSFLAVPIKTNGNLFGVITLARPVAGLPFSMQDIELVEYVARRLASAISGLQEKVRRERLLISLAHEINTPLTAILADAENLSNELAKKSDLYRIARHSMEQVLRLHMQTTTIMMVLTDQTATPEFEDHNLFRPLKEACELFESEALQKGCDILGPRPIGENFPRMEMCLGELTIAFKNLIHNAIKYSFNPPAQLDKHRSIKVWGQWENDRQHYLVSIQNYGVGIQEDEIQKRLIFEPYYRGILASDRKRTGAGFGLAYVRQVIEELHQGSITVTSKQQGGEAYLTTFIVRLPIKHLY
jgi:signal transduction histidine kinase